LDQSLRTLRVASQQAESVENKFGQSYSAWIDEFEDAKERLVGMKESAILPAESKATAESTESS
jgi:hypothetical protein